MTVAAPSRNVVLRRLGAARSQPAGPSGDALDPAPGDYVYASRPFRSTFWLPLVLSAVVRRMSGTAALLDDGAWTLSETRRAITRAALLQEQTRELVLTYRSHRVRGIGGSSG